MLKLMVLVACFCVVFTAPGTKHHGSKDDKLTTGDTADVKHKDDKHKHGKPTPVYTTDVNATDIKHKNGKHKNNKQTAVNTTETEQQCVNDFVSWCKAMKFPSENEGETMISAEYSSGDQVVQELCYFDYQGINCTNDSNPWFSCLPNGILIYNNHNLTMNSTAGADDNVCSTVENINNLGLETSTFDNAMREFQKQMNNFF